MIARILPLEANRSAFIFGMSVANAAIKATSELRGKIVAAKKADKKSTNSAIVSTLEMFLYFQ